MKLTKESADVIVKIELTGTEAKHLRAILNYSGDTHANLGKEHTTLEVQAIEATSLQLWRALDSFEL